MITLGALFLYMLFAFGVGCIVGVFAAASLPAFAAAWQEVRYLQETRRQTKAAWKAIERFDKLLQKKAEEAFRTRAV